MYVYLYVYISVYIDTQDSELHENALLVFNGHFSPLFFL